MSEELILELFGPSGWFEFGRVREGDPAGSMSNNVDGKRDVIYFHLEPDYAVIERSRLGVDAEVGSERMISALGGFEPIARLYPGERHEQLIQTDKMSRPMKVRFRLGS